MHLFHLGLGFKNLFAPFSYIRRMNLLKYVKDSCTKIFKLITREAQKNAIFCQFTGQAHWQLPKVGGDKNMW